jgi:hypothetical protein
MYHTAEQPACLRKGADTCQRVLSLCTAAFWSGTWVCDLPAALALLALLQKVKATPDSASFLRYRGQTQVTLLAACLPAGYAVPCLPAGYAGCVVMPAGCGWVCTSCTPEPRALAVL